MRNPCIGCGPGGETQEPGQAKSATSSFLAALRAAGIQVPQGVDISDRVVRESPSAAALSANAQAGASQGAQVEVLLGSLGAATEQENIGSASLGILTHEAAFRAVTFADAVRECVEDDAMSSVSEKGAVPEGHRNVLLLLYQLCPAAAPESPPAPRRVCDFEGLSASVDRPSAAEGAPTMFHRVAELRAEHYQRFRVAA